MTYEPTIETARKAPAVVCAVASRTKRLREKMEAIRKMDVKSFNLHEVEQLETIISDALTYDGGAMEMGIFDDILEATPDESNWKTSYDWKIKQKS